MDALNLNSMINLYYDEKWFPAETKSANKCVQNI